MSAHPAYRTPCEGDPCTKYGPGHQIHWIHAKVVGQEPLRWRDAIVTAVDGDAVVASYLHHNAQARLWSHDPEFLDALPIGTAFSIHAERVASCAIGWLSVFDSGDHVDALDPIPEGVTRSDQLRQRVIGDLATGRALPVDFPEFKEP